MVINIYTDKEKHCYKYDVFHNSYGPDETESDGYKTYYIDGLNHNIHGPAAFYPDGEDEYYLDDIKYSKEQWEKKRHEY